MDIEELLQERLRREILELLECDTDYTLHSEALQSLLDALGENVSLELIHASLAWLAERGLVTVEPLPVGMYAGLTLAGLDVAKGRTRVSGIKRPLPR